MKGIRKVKVGHLVYRVCEMTPEEAEEIEAYGVTNHRTCTIKINSTQDFRRQVETLWHEIKHAVHEIVDLDDGCKEEDYCRRAAPLEISVLCSNPQLLSLIRKVAAEDDEEV